MNKYTAAMSSIVMLLGISGTSVADQARITTFDIVVSVGDNTVFNTTETTPQDKRITLPSAFSRYDCKFTNTFISPDGKSYYRNVVCIDPQASIVIGTSVSCSIKTPSSGTGSFFLRSGDVDVTFSAACKTQ